MPAYMSDYSLSVSPTNYTVPQAGATAKYTVSSGPASDLFIAHFSVVHGPAYGGCVQLHDQPGGPARWSRVFDAEHDHDGSAGGDAGREFADATFLCDLAGGSGIDSAGHRSRRGPAPAPRHGNVISVCSVRAAPAAAGVQPHHNAAARKRYARRQLPDHAERDGGQRYEKLHHLSERSVDLCPRTQEKAHIKKSHFSQRTGEVVPAWLWEYTATKSYAPADSLWCPLASAMPYCRILYSKAL